MKIDLNNKQKELADLESDITKLQEAPKISPEEEIARLEYEITNEKRKCSDFEEALKGVQTNETDREEKEICRRKELEEKVICLYDFLILDSSKNANPGRAT